MNAVVAPGLEWFTLSPTGVGSMDYWKEAALAKRVRLQEGRNVIRLTSLMTHKWMAINVVRIRLVSVAR